MKHIKKFIESSNSENIDGLSNDIEIFKIDSEKPKKIKNGEYEIEQVIDVFSDPEDIKKKFGNEYIEEALGGTIGMHADISVKETKRGDIIWITALLRKRGTTSFTSPAVQGILKVRVVDIYYGLQYLNKVINR